MNNEREGAGYIWKDLTLYRTSRGGDMFRRVNTPVDNTLKMENWRLTILIILCGIIGAGAGADLIIYYKLPNIIGVTAGIIIAYFQMYFFIDIWKKRRSKKNDNRF